jgi:hypothetical protein
LLLPAASGFVAGEEGSKESQEGQQVEAQAQAPLTQ